MSNLKFFDLHSHPILKTLFKPQDGNQFSPWISLEPKDGILGNILESQCSLNMLAEKGNINLVCLTLHAPEMGMINQVLLKLAAITFFRQYLDKGRLRSMYSGNEGYQTVFKQEFANLILQPPAGKNIKLLKSWTEYNKADFKTLHVVFNIEGGHVLYDNENTFKDINLVISNLDTFSQKGYLILYLTPTHLTPNVFITHAYGNKILTKRLLLPKGAGITKPGKQLIDAAYSRNILIDIKHMSLVSRRIFYKIHQQLYPNKPIIASHIGLTGLSWTQYSSREFRGVKQKSYGYKIGLYKNEGELDNNTRFYPLSINLFNEDIVAILNCKGLIGLSLDVRILGGKDDINKIQFDFLSNEEFKIITSENPEALIEEMVQKLLEGETDPASISIDINEEPEDIEDMEAMEEEFDEYFQETPESMAARPHTAYHARLLVNHLVKILRITEMYNLPLPWDNICIGSDFDGMVQAVDCCRNVTEFDEFADVLLLELTNSIAKHHLNLKIEPALLIRKICFDNAHDFLQKHFR